MFKVSFPEMVEIRQMVCSLLRLTVVCVQSIVQTNPRGAVVLPRFIALTRFREKERERESRKRVVWGVGVEGVSE